MPLILILLICQGWLPHRELLATRNSEKLSDVLKYEKCKSWNWFFKVVITHCTPIQNKIFNRAQDIFGFPRGPSGKEPACQCRRHETWVQSLGGEDPLTHSGILAWKITWPEEPGWQQSIGTQRVRHYWSNLAQQAHTRRFNSEWKGRQARFPTTLL